MEIAGIYMHIISATPELSTYSPVMQEVPLEASNISSSGRFNSIIFYFSISRDYAMFGAQM
jgi:hypothetical protein